MKSQSIKDGMSRGEWRNAEDPYVRVINMGNSSIVTDSKEDALAITTAVNGTYGKGIDPECVEEAFTLLEEAVNNVSNPKYITTISKIQQLLTRSKLK